ncbi:MAG TPA: hypothetical protein VK507_14465 [Iamia sp.]|nr:hypothetical protein [Iamia sp.]
MTDDRTLADLDARARAAATGVRTAVAERSLPAFDPDLVRIDVDARPERPSRARPVVGLLAAAAAVLVVVAAVVALAGQGDEDSTPTDRIGADEVRRYVLGEVPDGYALASVFDAAAIRPFDPQGDFPFGPLAMYGPDGATPRVGVYAWPVPDGAEPLDMVDGMTEIEIAGRPAWESADDSGPNGRVLVVDVDGTFVGVIGAAADRAEQDAVGAAVTVDGDHALLPTDRIPNGWEHLGDGHYLDASGSIAGLRSSDGAGRSWTAAYSREGIDDIHEGAVIVSAAAGDSIRARGAMLGTTDVADVTVRGHDALLSRLTFETGEPGALTLTWEERPGEIVQVGGLDTLGRDELIALAEGLRTVEAGEVDGLRRQIMEAAATRPGVTVVGRGTFAGGADWILLSQGEGEERLTLETTAPDDGTSSFSSSGNGLGPDAQPLPDEEAFVGGVGSGGGSEVEWAYGELSADVVEVRVRDEDGAALTPSTIVEADGIRGWVVELPPSEGEGPTIEITAIGTGGTGLQSIDLTI